MSGNSSVSLSVIAGEVIQSGTAIKIRTAQPVDARSARNAVLLRQNGKSLAAPLTIDEKGVTIEVSTRNAEIGTLELHIHELSSIHSQQLVKHQIIPVRVGKFKGKIPSDVRVEYATHVALGRMGTRRLAPGEPAPDEYKYVEFIKGTHREKGHPVDLAFNERGEKVDGRAMLADIDKQKCAKYGLLHRKLFDKLEKSKESDKIEVAVWPRFKVDLTSYEKPNNGEIKEIPAAAKELLKEVARAKATVSDALKKLGATEQDTGAPVVYAALTPSQIRSVAKAVGIGRIFLHDQTSKDDLADSEAISFVTQAHALGFTGAGVHVAVFERNPDDVSNLSIAGKHLTSPDTSSHARLTHGIIKNIEGGEKPHGYAPDCQLYSANSYSNTSLQWAVSSPQLCTVISQSFHRTLENDGPGQDEEFSGQLSLDDHLKDQIATQYPYPMIVHAAGNGEDTEFVNHKGYNTISVGNHDDFATAMSPSTVFTNPSSVHGDRELPEIAANGTQVSAVGVVNSGTSFSAPAVAGTVAVLQSVDGTLKSWPEGCRAILFASADRTGVSGGTWVDDLGLKTDQSDGAGALNAQMGVLVAQQRQPRNNPAVPRGWDVGSVLSADFGTDLLAKYRYHVRVPTQRHPFPLPFVYTVKVALAWDSKVTTNSAGVQTSSLTVDLDLIVRDSAGVQVAASASWDNSYEIVEFKGNAGASYEIIIRRWSGTDIVWFGIAWNVTSRLAFNPPLIAGME